MKKGFFTCLFFACVLVFQAAAGFSQENFTAGEDLFMRNMPKEAAVYLENAVSDDPNNVTAYLYLGIVYEQIGRADEAAAVYRQVLDRAGDFTANVANNLGNVYFKKGLTDEAEAMYTRAIEANAEYPDAFLGRANTRIKKGALKEAVADYERYLQLSPRSPQRPAIEQLTARIKADFAEAERRRLAVEEAARAEAERRQRLLDEVSASLQSAAGSSQGLSTGAEEVEGYEGEFELQ